MSSDIAITVENLSKCYQIYNQPGDRLKQFLLPRFQKVIGKKPKQYFKEFWALSGVSFELRKGETVGIIGRNGSGKSTLLQLVCGTLNPTSGSITTHGRIAALLELGSGFNPQFTGRENVYLNGNILGLNKEEIDARFNNIAAFADIGDFIDQPVKTYSSGMMVRLAFAVSINVAPEILVIDEALAVGDAAFQRKCIRKIQELSDEGVTLLFVSHSTETVKQICNRAIYLRQGEIRSTGQAKDVCIEYERDLFGAEQMVEASSSKKVEEKDAIVKQPILDPELLVTNEQIYGDGRVRISDITIRNKRGQRINLLETMEDFSVTYQVLFTGFADQPVLGIMITTREGLCVFGTNTEGRAISHRRYKHGDKIRIVFNLTNNLGPGIYYLTCGVYSCEHSEGLVYLQRRIDNTIFKSLSNTGCVIGGTANLNPRIEEIIVEGKH